MDSGSKTFWSKKQILVKFEFTTVYRFYKRKTTFSGKKYVIKSPKRPWQRSRNSLQSAEKFLSNTVAWTA